MDTFDAICKRRRGTEIADVDSKLEPQLRDRRQDQADLVDLAAVELELETVVEPVDTVVEPVETVVPLEMVTP